MLRHFRLVSLVRESSAWSQESRGKRVNGEPVSATPITRTARHSRQNPKAKSWCRVLLYSVSQQHSTRVRFFLFCYEYFSRRISSPVSDGAHVKRNAAGTAVCTRCIVCKRITEFTRVYDGYQPAVHTPTGTRPRVNNTCLTRARLNFVLFSFSFKPTWLRVLPQYSSYFEVTLSSYIYSAFRGLLHGTYTALV